MTVAQIYEEISNLDLLDIRVPVRRKGKDLILTPEILALFTPDSTGRLHPLVDASGRMTEVSAAAIKTAIEAVETKQGIIKNLMVSISGSFEGGVDNETDAWRFQHKVLFGALIADGAGEISPTNFAPALAGYRTCIKVTHVFSNMTQAAITFVFGTTTGLSKGVVDIDITTIADSVGPEYGPGLPWEGSAANEAIFCSCAAGQCQNNQLIWLIGEIWYELV